MPSTPLLFGLAIILAAVISLVQSLIGQNIGSDHAVHAFLTQQIRKNRFRLFTRVPGLLNDSYCAAVPLYIHWVVAHFKSRAEFWSERLLNPVVNALHVTLLGGIAIFIGKSASLPAAFPGISVCLFALTPQSYHVLAARNFGLSARGTGLLLLTAFFFAAYAAEEMNMPALAWPALAVFGWLVWGFSTFAQQAMSILSVLMLIITGRFTPLAGAALGLSLFIALHPRYSFAYLRHTFSFIRAYAKELAPIYILRRRESIWRDLVWDIWRRFYTHSAAQGLRYAYENSVVIVTLLNPLAIWCWWSAAHGADLHDGILGFCLSLAICGSVAALLTSFRLTRFLGEPERYIEAISPWATLYGASSILQIAGLPTLVWLAAVFFLIDGLQLIGSRVLLNYVGERSPALRQIASMIEARWARNARVSSNNEHYTKLLMQHDWKYAYFLAVGRPYCDMTVTQAFSTFPVLRREACERIVERFRINSCLLDRNEYDVLFERRPHGLTHMSVAFESDRFRLLFLEWAPTDCRLEPR